MASAILSRTLLARRFIQSSLYSFTPRPQTESRALSALSNYRLKPTGVLDADTTFKMALPRCGVPDISDGINHILASRNKRRGRAHGNRTNLLTVSHFTLYKGNPKWNKKQLSYAFYQRLIPKFKDVIGGAFKKWAPASHYFTFRLTADAKTSDIKIGFERGDHGDGHPFYGRLGVLAHAQMPPGGTFHFDGEEEWVVGPGANWYSLDVETVALHEIGHLLGLEHSHILEAIMYPAVPMADTKGLHFDDINGIKTLYHVRY